MVLTILLDMVTPADIQFELSKVGDALLKKAAVPYVKWNFLFVRDGYKIDGDGTIAV